MRKFAKADNGKVLRNGDTFFTARDNVYKVIRVSEGTYYTLYYTTTMRVIMTGNDYTGFPGAVITRRKKLLKLGKLFGGNVTSQWIIFSIISCWIFSYMAKFFRTHLTSSQ